MIFSKRTGAFSFPSSLRVVAQYSFVSDCLVDCWDSSPAFCRLLAERTASSSRSIFHHHFDQSSWDRRPKRTVSQFIWLLRCHRGYDHNAGCVSPASRRSCSIDFDIEHERFVSKTGDGNYLFFTPKPGTKTRSSSSCFLRRRCHPSHHPHGPPPPPTPPRRILLIASVIVLIGIGFGHVNVTGFREPFAPT